MTWTDFKEYSSDVQLQIGQRIQDSVNSFSQI